MYSSDNTLSTAYSVVLVYSLSPGLEWWIVALRSGQIKKSSDGATAGFPDETRERTSLAPLGLVLPFLKYYGRVNTDTYSFSCLCLVAYLALRMSSSGEQVLEIDNTYASSFPVPVTVEYNMDQHGGSLHWCYLCCNVSFTLVILVRFIK